MPKLEVAPQIQELNSTVRFERTTHLIEHPVMKQPPFDPRSTIVVPLMLTKDERKKLRRRQREEVRKDREERILMGIDPPIPNKVRISNLMRVLTSESVKDPTAIERKVRAEVHLYFK